ncbi:MAG: (4Fe-4S)-binding protein [Bacteroidota bacterium]
MSDLPKIKEYSNGEVTIVWEAKKCIHAAKCVKGLPTVFDVKARPWINAEGASTAAIIEQVGKCPSGALTSFMNAEGKPKADVSEPATSNVEVEVLPNGPLVVFGTIAMKGPDGSVVQEKTRHSFCRCGASSNKPYCDGSHRRIDFQG